LPELHDNLCLFLAASSSSIKNIKDHFKGSRSNPALTIEDFEMQVRNAQFLPELDSEVVHGLWYNATKQLYPI
jgi:hypothetical protein